MRSMLFLFFALFASAWAATINGCKGPVVKNNMKIVRSSFTEPKPFCNYWLNAKRNVPPLKSIEKVGQFTKACECISKKRASVRPARAVKNQGPVYKCLPVPSQKLSRKFKAPTKPKVKSFCAYWNAKNWRPASPFQDMTVRQIYNACQCFGDFVPPKDATTTTTTTTTKKPASTSTSTTKAGTTVAPTTVAPVTTVAPTTVAPVTTLLPTTLPPIITTLPPVTVAPVTTAAPTTQPTTTTSHSTASAAPSSNGNSTGSQRKLRARGRKYSNAILGDVSE